MKSLFKSEKGRNEILSLYENKLAQLNIDYRYKVVNTSYGKTNIIIHGESNKPPLMVVHGSNGCAPIALEVYSNLYLKFQVFAIDVLAQPTKSAETRLSMKDDSYGRWMADVIELLELKNITMAGFSLGGLVILKTLQHDEQNIKEVYLTAPAYIVNGNPLKALFKIFIPMKMYMMTKSQKYIEKIVKVFFTERDEFAVKFLSSVFLNFKMDFTPVPVIKAEDAKAITTPITLIGAKEDILFPGVKMINRAKTIFPSLQETLLLEESKHVQNISDNVLIEELIFKE